MNVAALVERYRAERVTARPRTLSQVKREALKDAALYEQVAEKIEANAVQRAILAGYPALIRHDDLMLVDWLNNLARQSRLLYGDIREGDKRSARLLPGSPERRLVEGLARLFVASGGTLAKGINSKFPSYVLDTLAPFGEEVPLRVIDAVVDSWRVQTESAENSSSCDQHGRGHHLVHRRVQMIQPSPTPVRLGLSRNSRKHPCSLAHA
jgi:hypothetical protein